MLESLCIIYSICRHIYIYIFIYLCMCSDTQQTIKTNFNGLEHKGVVEINGYILAYHIFIPECVCMWCVCACDVCACDVCACDVCVHVMCVHVMCVCMWSVCACDVLVHVMCVCMWCACACDVCVQRWVWMCVLKTFQLVTINGNKMFQRTILDWRCKKKKKGNMTVPMETATS